MTKFQKRILKTTEKIENCLIVGQGFGFLEECLEIFKTVFVINEIKPSIRTKNLIFRDDGSDLSQISDITHVIFDRNNINELVMYQTVWNKHNSVVIIEGDEPIGREFSKPLYDTAWNCVDKQGFFHVWKGIK